MLFKSLVAIAAALTASAAWAQSTSRGSYDVGASPSMQTSSDHSSRMAASTAADAASASAASGTVPSSCIGLIGSERSSCIGRFGAISGRG